MLAVRAPLLRRFRLEPLNGMEHHLCGGLELELFLDAIAEGIDCGDGEVQVLGDLARAFALPSMRKTSISRSLSKAIGEAGWLSGRA